MLMTQKTNKETREYEQLKKKVSTYYADDVFKNALMASEESVGNVSPRGFHFDTLFAYPGMKEYFAENGMICNSTAKNTGYLRFDAKLHSDIYIDFKNYADGEISTSRLNDLITYTQEKAIKVGAKKAYIVNLTQAEDVTSKTYDAYIESFVPIVYINGLLDKEGSVIPSHLSQFLEGDYGQSND